MFLSKRVIIIKLSKDAYKRKMATLDLVINIKVITKNNHPGNTY